MAISIIVPTYNEECTISDQIDYLLKGIEGLSKAEIIIIDGGSSDETMFKARSKNVTAVRSPSKGRAAQMNYGASIAKNDILYFVHADTQPPLTFVDDILESFTSNYESGCYRYQFKDYPTPLLRINAYCTRFKRIMCRGGDQTLFIKKDLFNELGRFREDYLIMEDYDFIQKLMNRKSFRVIQKDAFVSARKYDHNGYFQVNFANLVVFMMYFAGASQELMVHAYKNLIYHPKMG